MDPVISGTRIGLRGARHVLHDVPVPVSLSWRMPYLRRLPDKVLLYTCFHLELLWTALCAVPLHGRRHDLWLFGGHEHAGSLVNKHRTRTRVQTFITVEIDTGYPPPFLPPNYICAIFVWTLRAHLIRYPPHDLTVYDRDCPDRTTSHVSEHSTR